MTFAPVRVSAKTYTVYHTENAVNGNFYIGVHKTTDPDDEYLGSGKVLKWAIAKYGRGAFRKVVLFEFEDAESAFVKEAELIAEAKQSSQCYNLKQGGLGGFEFINSKRLNLCGVAKGGRAFASKLKTDGVFAAKSQSQRVAGVIRWNREHPAVILERAAKGRQVWTGAKHSPEARIVMSEKASKERNSQFGKCWITDGVKNKIVPAINLSLIDGWYKGRTLCVNHNLIVTHGPVAHRTECFATNEEVDWVQLPPGPPAFIPQ